MSLTSIKELAEQEYTSFLQSMHDDYPELILKYQINNNTKVDFVEAVIRQVWIGKEYDKIDILDFMANRGNR